MTKTPNYQKLALLMVLLLAFFLVKSRWQRDKDTKGPVVGKPIVQVIDEPRVPVFEDFPAEESATGTPAKVDFGGNDPALQFRSQISKAVAKGPNFAGHYSVATWGCGSACQQSAVIDTVTGKIVSYNILTAAGVDFQLNSRLLIAHKASPNAEQGSDIPHFYVIRGNEFRLNGLVDPDTGAYVPFQAD